MKIFKDKLFEETSYLKLFGMDWENGEVQEEFIKRIGYYDPGNVYAGFLKVCIPSDETDLSKRRKGYLVFLDSETLFEEFYIPDIIDLIDFFHYLGLSFGKEMASLLMFRRRIDQSDLDECTEYLSVTQLDEGMVYVTSYDPITTAYERQESLRRARQRREEKKKESAQDSPKKSGAIPQ